MENAETILVVILATFLALFLILAIVLVIKCIQIAKSMQRIAEKAEQVVDKASDIGTFFSKATGTFSAGRFLSQLADSVLHKDNKKGRR